MSNPCNECPFLKSTPLVGAPDWLKDVFAAVKEDPFFVHSCHQTDPRADGFKGIKKNRECAGNIFMMINEIDKTPGRNGVYSSYIELIETYLVHWLGEEKLNKLRAEHRATKSGS